MINTPVRWPSHGAATPLITIIVATYGRPQVLACALEAARRQTEDRWRALVIGDACAPDTVDVVESLGDSRVRFVNLPARQGEQSRPNSVGMRLADTPLLAFLNQDDLWLDDHLSRAVAAIRIGADFYAASAAFAHERRTVAGVVRPVFSERTPDERSLMDAFWSAPFVFEPASSWVVTRQLAQHVGPWKPADELHRMPLQDWILRVWRMGASFRHEAAITTLKVNTHHEAGASRQYDVGAEDHRVLLDLMAMRSVHEMRTLVAWDLASASAMGLPVRDPNLPFGASEAGMALAMRLRDPSAVARYLDTAVDEFDAISAQLGRKPGHFLRAALLARTGEQLPPPSDLDLLVEDARASLREL